MSAGLVDPIPWGFTDAPGILLWSWVTESFIARISGAEVALSDSAVDAAELAPGLVGRRFVRSYTWDVSDRMRTHQGLPRLLIDGTSSTFVEAETLVREHVGKLYDPRLGYRRFSGALAFTFTLATGESLDVSGFIGTHCNVTVLLPDGSERTVSGDFDVESYRWSLSAATEVVEIVPEHVVRVSNRSEAAERAQELTRLDSYSGFGRMYREDPRPGCTGRAGFTVGTVDHAGAPRCPLHEEGLPEHLLG